MTKNEDNKRKIAEFLYDKTTNTSSRKLTRPQDNDKILQPIEIGTINTGKDFIQKKSFVRIQFKGSDTWYSMHFRDDTSLKAWNDKIYNIDFDNDMPDEDKKETPW